jgi:hypothetical protein
MRLSARGFLTPAQVERGIRAWLEAGFGPGNAHLARELGALLRASELSGDGAAVLALGREDVLAAAPHLTDRQVDAILARDWEAEMGPAREEVMRALRAHVEKEFPR